MKIDITQAALAKRGSCNGGGCMSGSIRDLIEQGAVDLVQTRDGKIWLVSSRDYLLKLDFWPDMAGEKAEFIALLPCVTAWRESGKGAGATFGRWHNVGEAS